MKRVRAILAISLVSTSLPLAAQERPIADAVSRAAMRLAFERSSSQVSAGWDRVMRLRGGVEVFVSTTGSSTMKRTMVAADDSTLFVLDLDYPALPSRAARKLKSTAELDSAALVDAAAGRRVLVLDGVEVGAGGVTERGQKIAPGNIVLQAIPAADVLAVHRRGRRSGDGTRGALLGALAGALAGPFVGALLEPDCACDDPGLAGGMYGFIIGVPAGAIGGYYLAAGPTRDYVYRK